MDNSYIKKINGYFVKDEEARKKITDIIDGTQTVGEASKVSNPIQFFVVDEQGKSQYVQYDGSQENTVIGDDLVIANAAYAYQANKDSEGNIISTTYAQIEKDLNPVSQKATDAYNLAVGIKNAHPFDSVTEMTSKLKAASKDAYKIGDQLLIREADVPDYWISGTLDTNTGTYGYYEITILETQKVDLSGYATNESLKDYATKKSLENYATTSGTFPSMKVGSASTAGKVAKALKIQLLSGVTPIQYDGSAEITIGTSNNPIAYAGHATTADSAYKDGSGNNIVGTYATKEYADAYNITFSVSDEELTIKKNGKKPFSA